MQEAGITVRHRKKYKVTTNSNHQQPLFENVLDRQFSVSGPDQAMSRISPICGPRRVAVPGGGHRPFSRRRWAGV